MVAVENTPDTHNMVVCTLCSCYPWTVLGLPPVWYKSPPYRSRAVIDPRGVLAEFGVTLPETTKIRVWDSTAEIRYLVVPMRPAGTEGWREEELADLVTRDSMIGTGLPRPPARRAADRRAGKWFRHVWARHVNDPVDLEKLRKWTGRDPSYSVVVAEPLQEDASRNRLIAYLSSRGPRILAHRDPQEAAAEISAGKASRGPR